MAVFNREQAIKQFTELSRRSGTNAYAEREPDSSYGAYGIDESIDSIINAAAREGLAFVYQEEGDTYTLEQVPLGLPMRKTARNFASAPIAMNFSQLSTSNCVFSTRNV